MRSSKFAYGFLALSKIDFFYETFKNERSLGKKSFIYAFYLSISNRGTRGCFRGYGGILLGSSWDKQNQKFGIQNKATFQKKGTKFCSFMFCFCV